MYAGLDSTLLVDETLDQSHLIVLLATNTCARLHERHGPRDIATALIAGIRPYPPSTNPANAFL